MTQPKRIVIGLDGTWQSPYRLRQRDDGSRVLKPTNVLKLCRAVVPADPRDGRPQLTFYDAGLGALVRYPGPANRTRCLLDRLFGGLWGAGFEAGVEDAFRFLVHNHRPGDQVFVIGYSRGAAQARALTHFLDWLGGLPAKADAYFGPLLFLHWVRTRGLGRPEEVATSDGRRPDRPPEPLVVELLGVWDTVAALGSRLRAAAGGSSRHWSYLVRDTPAACVRHARHALAVDERRFDFKPELWRDRAPGRTLEQRWFAGSHANVGGGSVHDGLANVSLRWLLGEAEALGLAVDRDFIRPYNPYPQDRLYPSVSLAYRAAELLRLRPGGGRRSLLGHPEPAGHVLDRSVIHRLRSDPADHARLERYRPPNVLELLAAQPDLDAFLAGLGLDPGEARLPPDVTAAIEGLRRPT